MTRLAILGFVAAAPVAFVFCTKPSETPSAVDASIVADPAIAVRAVPPLADPATASSAGVAAPPVAAIVSASASSSATAPPSKRQACEALQSKVRALLTNSRACARDADCDNVMTGCGLDGQCGASIAKTSTATVKKVADQFYAKSCLDVLPPQPCATCAMPPPPKCANGQCN